MKKNKKAIILSLLILLLSSFLLLFYDLFFKIDNRNKSYEISVIASGKSDESFLILKEGAEQAALECNVNIRFLFLSSDNNEQEQIELIKRECENSVDAILVAPIECDEVMKVIDEARKKVKVIVMQSLAESDGNLDRVVCNEFKLGESLAKVAIENSNMKSNVMVIDNNYENSINKERYSGVVSVLDGMEVKYLLAKSDIFLDYSKFNEVIKENDIDTVICLDRFITEKIGEYKKQLISEKVNNTVFLYGVGNTYKIISLLEEEVVNGTAIQNEFNIGYIAVQNAIVLIDGKKVKNNKEIMSTVITSNDMYSPKNERILFQFIR